MRKREMRDLADLENHAQFQHNKWDIRLSFWLKQSGHSGWVCAHLQRGEHSCMNRGANGVTEGFECPLMTPFSAATGLM